MASSERDGLSVRETLLNCNPSFYKVHPALRSCTHESDPGADFCLDPRLTSGSGAEGGPWCPFHSPTSFSPPPSSSSSSLHR
jgi:hypothetical protein